MKNTVHITRARHAWPEEKGFTINRPKGLREYTFLRFHGSMQIRIDNELVTTQPGTCVFYGVDTPQWFHSPGPLIHDWMHMAGDVPGSLQAVGLEMNRLYSPGDSRFVTAILREIEFELLTHPAPESALLELKYRELLLKLARAVSEENTEGPLKPGVKTQLRQVRSQVFTRLEHPWTVQEMAELAYVSASRFYTVYRAAFGISPMDDLIHARIDTAKNRLYNSDESIQSIATGLGYRNVTHFCRQFKKITGLTPMEFRRGLEG